MATKSAKVNTLLYGVSHLAVVAVLCIALGAGAAGAINMWYDRDIDLVMTRTMNRPLPAGRLRPVEALALGVGLALAGGSLIKSFLFGMKPNDPVAVAGAVALMAAVAAVAGFLPARRASRVDPMVALRDE